MNFPQFDAPKPLDDGRSWAARFESWDQRTDDVYYTIRIVTGGQITSTFLGKISYLGQDQDDPALPGFLESQLHAIAATGATNTDYVGSQFAAR